MVLLYKNILTDLILNNKKIAKQWNLSYMCKRTMFSRLGGLGSAATKVTSVSAMTTYPTRKFAVISNISRKNTPKDALKHENLSKDEQEYLSNAKAAFKEAKNHPPVGIVDEKNPTFVDIIGNRTHSKMVNGKPTIKTSDNNAATDEFLYVFPKSYTTTTDHVKVKDVLLEHDSPGELEVRKQLEQLATHEE